MTFKNRFLAVAATVLAASSIASALPTFTASGLFSANQGSTILSNGNTTATNNGVSVTYTGNTENLVLDVAGPSFSNANFGTFSITGTPTVGRSSTLVASFTLTILQSSPAGGSQSFGIGSISGEIFAGASGAFIQFTSPLALTFTNGTTAYTYSILSADTVNPGRVALNNPGSDTTVQGRVSVAAVAVPLPASVWGGIGLFVAMGTVQASRKLRQ